MIWHFPLIHRYAIPSIHIGQLSWMGVLLANSAWWLLQWIDGVLSGGGEGEFFCDEFRCPIYVKDVVNVIELLIAKSIATEGSHMHLVLNLGGPDKVSRADMADVVAEVQGYNKEFVKRVSALSVSTRNLIGTTIILFNSRPLSMRAVQNWSQMKCHNLQEL